MTFGMEVGLGPGDFVFDGDPATPRKKGTPTPHPIFGPCLLCQTAGWIKMPCGTEANLGPDRRCVRWGRSYPLKGAQPQFSTHAYCDQTVGLMKTPLGTEIDIGPGHIVLDGDTAPPKSGTSALSFRPLSIVATVAHLSYC